MTKLQRTMGIIVSVIVALTLAVTVAFSIHFGAAQNNETFGQLVAVGMDVLDSSMKNDLEMLRTKADVMTADGRLGSTIRRGYVGTLQELQDRASMRNGVAGAARTGDPVDAYTGKPLRLRAYPDGRFSYAGGFNPRRAFTDLDELLYYLTMRNGVASRAKPAPKPAVAAAKADTAARPDARTTPSDATLEEMERVAAGHMQRGTVVSMAPSARKPPAPRGPANRHARTGGK